jgi:hypothetical protein
MADVARQTLGNYGKIFADNPVGHEAFRPADVAAAVPGEEAEMAAVRDDLASGLSSPIIAEAGTRNTAIRIVCRMIAFSREIPLWFN